MEKQENILSQHSDNDTDEKDATITESRDDIREKPEYEAGTDLPQLDPSNGDAPATVQTPEEWEYVTGFKILVAIAAVTAAVFIMLLDTSIVATVSEFSETKLVPH